MALREASMESLAADDPAKIAFMADKRAQMIDKAMADFERDYAETVRVQSDAFYAGIDQQRINI